MKEIKPKEKDKKQPHSFKKFIPIPIIMAVMTALVTWLRINPDQPFISVWFTFYSLAIFIVLPIGLFGIKGIHYILKIRLNHMPEIIKSGLSGMFMALIMGSLMTGASLYSLKDHSTFIAFIVSWKQIIGEVIPYILTIGLTIGLIVKPIVNKKMARIKQSK